jgi:hypothetical protein
MSKINYLPRAADSVKIFLIFFMALCAQSWGETRNPPQVQAAYLSIGEIQEFSVPNLSHFAVGNSDIISYRHSPKTAKLLIKGKKLGTSEVVLWMKDKSKQTIPIFVVSKQKQLSLLFLAETLRRAGLVARPVGAYIEASGEIVDEEGFKLLRKLMMEYPGELHLAVSMGAKLARELLGRIYVPLFAEYVDEISCRPRGIGFDCFHSTDNPPNPKLAKYLQDQFGVSFIPITGTGGKRNYRIKLKLVQLERLDGREIHFGLSHLQGSLNELFSLGPVGLAKRNQFLLQENNLDFSTLAEPEAIIREGHPVVIEVGADIPYSTPVANSSFSTTNWKFAGLRIELNLKRQAGQFVLSFKTQFTRPGGSDGTVVGNREESKASIPLSHALELFQIGFQTESKENQSMPWFSKVPLLGNLFQSKSNQKSYKRISAIAVLELMNE